MMGSTAQLVAAAAAPVLAAVIVYLPALGNGFIWDDPIVLQQTRAIDSARDLLIPPPIIPKFYFRPLIFLSYLLDRALGGESPMWFHASVIAQHALNTLLVFVFAHRLFPSEWLIASGGALLFAVFPTHVESVAWMAGRSDVIVCTFVLLTVLLFMKRDRRWTCWLGGLTLLLAMLSKEMAVACVALIPMLDLLQTRRLYWARYVPVALVTVVYFLLRRQALGAVVGGMATGASPAALGLDLLRALGFYVARAIVPAPLCAYIPEVPAAAGYAPVGLLAVLIGFAFIRAAWRRHPEAGHRVQLGEPQTAILLLWFFVTLAPSLAVIVRRSASAPVAERYLYVPTVASCVLLAQAAVWLADSRRIARRWSSIIVIAVCAVFTAQVVRYTPVWTNNLTFWSDVAGKVPGHNLPQRELAAALMERGRLDEAERAFQRALAEKSDREGRAMTYSNLGNLYRRQGRYAEALDALDAGLRIAPHPVLFHNLGMTFMALTEQAYRQGDQAAVQRDIAKARDSFEQALALGNARGAVQVFAEWNGAKTHALLGQVLFSLGDRSGARAHLEASLKLQPTGRTAELTRQYMQKLEP